MPKRLEQPIDAHEFFKRASSFHYAYRFMEARPVEEMAPMAYSLIISAAFCVELYMKVLAQLQRNTPPLEGHNLKFLAGDLTSATYRRLAKAWREANKKTREAARKNSKIPQWAAIPQKFDIALDRSAKAFIDWRYGEKGVVKGWHLGGVAEELRAIILEMEPDWRPTKGALLALDPKPDFTEPKNNDSGLPAGFSVLDHKPAPLNVQVRRRADTKDGRSH